MTNKYTVGKFTAGKLAAGFAALLAVTLTAGVSHAAGDSQNGKKVFNKCMACHAVEAGKNKLGPSLHGVIGRKAGTVEGYKYSDAMKASNLTWNEETIAKFLADPKGTVAGSKMIFPGLKNEAEITDVISYLGEQK